MKLPEEQYLFQQDQKMFNQASVYATQAYCTQCRSSAFIVFIGGLFPPSPHSLIPVMTLSYASV
jgi:hypothetical protein